ncbi:filamentous hemagglutinin N-terminal domain-containing protein [Acaryochloris sp. IP29b_bin.148]|uniref:two-partner secretion domain-containing protein n=1 Tax=Acaryochloris sp. IP29b_bin.148 TaxID=2969218 RepID=UPI002624723D|nr:filamentous hemagglutinin N-terminal domain-containing protein [Acaryochloris sp. IP29b_bin.148]
MSAQIIPDSTLKNTTITSKTGSITTIDGGSQIGVDLFHSFSSLNSKRNEVIYFNNKNSIINIFARVTGKSSSNIDGKIRSNGTANLFLINPNGIIFGPNSSLDIGGSFLATTADGIKFNDGYIYSSSKKNIEPLLAIRNPIELLFSLESASIQNQSLEGLSVIPSRTISLIGKTLKLEGGNLIAPDGQIVLASVDYDNKISFSQNHSFPFDLIFNFDNVLNFEDIYISNLSISDVSGKKGGDIQVFGRNISLKEGGRIQSLTFGPGKGGEIIVNASESLSLLGNTNLNSPLDTRFKRFGFLIPQKTSILSSTLGTGRSASIKIDAKTLNIHDGADITTATDSLGAAGDISINILESMNISGEAPIIDLVQDQIPFNNPITRDFLIDASVSSAIRSRTPLTLDGGQGGNIEISTENLNLINGGFISTGSDKGQGGKLTISASGNVEIFGSTKSGAATSFLTAATNTNKNASALTLNAKNLFLREGGGITVSTFSSGKGGDITISTSESVQLSGVRRDGRFPSLINSGSFGSGDAGSILIKTNAFIVEDGAEISAPALNLGNGGNLTVLAKSVDVSKGGKILTSSLGFGNAGNINVSAVESIRISGQESGLFANTGGDAQGGNIFVKARDLTVQKEGKFVTTTNGRQSAGNIDLEVQDSILVEGHSSGLFANTAVGSTGPGGSITIDPRIVLIKDGAKISVNSEGTGPGGSIFLGSSNLFLDSGTISANSNNNIGGNISLSIENFILLRNGSNISTTSLDDATGGNIDIKADFIVAAPTENSDITANSFGGKGGQIRLFTDGIVGLRVREQNTIFSDITAISQNNPQLNGSVIVSTPETDPTDNLTEQSEVVEPRQEVAQGCRPGQALGGSTFVHVGRGGLPPGPHGTRTPNNIWQDLRTYNLQAPNTVDPYSISSLPTSSPKIVEATGWIKDSQGRIYLSARVPHPAHSPQPAAATC